MTCQFEDLKFISNNFISVEKDGKWGIYNIDKRVVTTSFKFNKIIAITEKFAAANLNDKWILIDMYGNTISEYYDNVCFNTTVSMFVNRNNKWILVNEYGKEISDEYDEIKDFVEGYALVKKMGNMALLMKMEH